MSETQSDVAVVETPASDVSLDGGQVTPIEPNAEEAVPAETKPEEPKTEEQPKKNHDQRRWERLMRERAEFKAKAELYEKMQTQQAQPQTNTGEPKREQFENDLAYLEARQDYKLQQVATQNQPRQPERNWIDLEKKARASYPDFDDVMEDARESGITIPQASADAISSSEIGADIQYYLAKNPNEAKRLWQMQNPVDQIRLIGKIEASIEAKKNQKPVRISSAPKPIAPVKPTASEVEIDRDKLSDAQWFELRRKEKERVLKERYSN